MREISEGIPSESFRTVYAISNYFEKHSDHMALYFTRKAQYKRFVETLLQMLLADSDAMRRFVDYGGEVEVTCTMGGEVTAIGGYKG